jgi:hypothetical protein
MRASQEQFRKVRDRFGPEVAGISIVLSGWAKLYPFPQVWMFFWQCPAIALRPEKVLGGHRRWPSSGKRTGMVKQNPSLDFACPVCLAISNEECVSAAALL